MAIDPQTQARADQAKALLDTYSEWIDRYRGGLPREMAATIMLWESGGNMNAPGDPSLGEAGLYQVASYVPALFGLPAEARLDPEANVAVGLAEYNLEVAKWKQFNDAVQLGSADSWKLARLTFAIGRGGAQTLAAMAGATTPGDVYGDIVRFFSSHPAPALGSQSGDKVQRRLFDIQTQWNIASLIGSLNPGPPTITPGPPGYEDVWTLPPDVVGYFTEPLEISTILLLGAGAVVAYYLLKRFR